MSTLLVYTLVLSSLGAVLSRFPEVLMASEGGRRTSSRRRRRRRRRNQY